MITIETAREKPVLSAESFQRLLAAAYMLQLHNEGRPSVHPSETAPTSPFAAGAIVQKRTPSEMIREPQGQEDHSGHVPFRSPNILENFTGGTDQTWRAVEALAIATVFCMMMGMSIHRLSALSGRTSLPSGLLEQRNASQSGRPTAKFLASSQQHIAVRNSPRSPDGGDADIVAEDIVIRYQKRAVNLPDQAAKKPSRGPVQAQLLPPKNTMSKPGSRLIFGRDADMLAAANTVVQYGPDVKMWSGDPKRAGLDRLGH